MSLWGHLKRLVCNRLIEAVAYVVSAYQKYADKQHLIGSGGCLVSHSCIRSSIWQEHRAMPNSTYVQTLFI